jgi:hypothetical protein
MNCLAPVGEYPGGGSLVVKVCPLLEQTALDETGDQPAGIRSFQRCRLPNVAKPGLPRIGHSGQDARFAHAEAAYGVNRSFRTLFDSMRQRPQPMPKQFAKGEAGHAGCFRLVTPIPSLSHGFVALTTKHTEIIVNHTIVGNNDLWQCDRQGDRVQFRL